MIVAGTEPPSQPEMQQADGTAADAGREQAHHPLATVDGRVLQHQHALHGREGRHRYAEHDQKRTGEQRTPNGRTPWRRRGRSARRRSTGSGIAADGRTPRARAHRAGSRDLPCSPAPRSNGGRPSLPAPMTGTIDITGNPQMLNTTVTASPCSTGSRFRSRSPGNPEHPSGRHLAVRTCGSPNRTVSQGIGASRQREGVVPAKRVRSGPPPCASAGPSRPRRRAGWAGAMPKRQTALVMHTGDLAAEYAHACAEAVQSGPPP